eukprot:m.164780 g.164780  ORF g.164780 m.164780 type:complete len:1438 (+) comp10319_c0_seq1:179-4492(+)
MARAHTTSSGCSAARSPVCWQTLLAVLIAAAAVAPAGAACICAGMTSSTSGKPVKNTQCGVEPVNKFQQNGVCVPQCDTEFYDTTPEADLVACEDELFCRVKNCAAIGTEPIFNSPDCSVCVQCELGYELALDQGSFQPCLVAAPPNVTCPDSIDVSFNETGTQFVLNFDDKISAVDNVQLESFTCNPPSGSAFAVDGISRTVTCTAVDINGFSSQCTFPVTVTDVEPPVFVQPCEVFEPQIVNQGEPARVEWSLPVATDNVDGNITATCSRNPSIPEDLFFNAGKTIITCEAVDSAGLSTECNIVIQVVDQSAPVLECPEELSATVALDKRDVIIDYASLVSARSSGTNATLTPQCSPVSGSPFLIGTSQVICTARDLVAQSQCTFPVEVIDDQPPILFGCPLTSEVPMIPGSTVATVPWSKPTAADNSGSVTVTCSRVEGDNDFSIGTTIINCQAIDSSRNVAQCAITVIVVDFEPPVITCPDNIEAGIPSGESTIPISWSLSATDNFDLKGSPTCNFVSGSDFSVGNFLVECTAFDLNDNEATCTFSIRVLDDAPPTIDCPTIPDTQTAPNSDKATISFAVDAIDNVAVDVVSCSHDPAGDEFSLGPTLVTCRANDTSGNIGTCSFEVNVIDKEKPKVTCPSTVFAEYEPPALNVEVTWPAPTATDNDVTGDLLLETLINNVGYQTSAVLTAGTTKVDFVATDAAGNFQECSFNIEVTRNGDFDPPVLTCPTLLNVTNTEKKRTALVEFEIGVSDASSTTQTVSSRPINGLNSGSEFDIGLTTITVTETDEFFNVATCEFDIIVSDAEPPFIDCPPSNSFNTPPGGNAAVATWPAVTTRDNYILAPGQPVVSVPSGSILGIGEHLIQASSTDIAGLTSYCNFTITIIGLAGNGTVEASSSNVGAAAAGGVGFGFVLLLLVAIIFLVRRHRKHVLEMEEKMSDFHMTDEAILARAQAIQVAMQNKAKGKAPQRLEDLGDGPKRKFMAPPPDLDDLGNLDKYMPYDSTIGELRREDVIIESEIGSGEFGSVYSGRVLFDGGAREVRVAIKSLKESSTDESRVTFLQEIAVQGQFTHPNIVGLVGYVTKDDPVLMCIEFMELGSLKSYLQSDIVKGQLTLRDFIRMASDVCAGMYYLGQCNFVHRDLAARNCLINQDLVVKIADFGLSVEMDSEAMAKSKANSQERIPIRWTSPEAIKDKAWSSASDVWSFGVVLWEMFTYAEHPYKGWTNRRVVDEVMDGYRLSVPPKCPMLIYAIMMDCWNIDVEERITFKVAYQRLQAAWAECIDGVVGYEAVARAGAYLSPDSRQLGNPDLPYAQIQDAVEIPGENYDNHDELNLNGTLPPRMPGFSEFAEDDAMYDMAGTGEAVRSDAHLEDELDETIYDEADDGQPAVLMAMTSRLSIPEAAGIDDIYDQGDADDAGAAEAEDATYDMADS